ncbi:lysine N(6)-hydroxylase/L-ornithine N(5)-oxygenase family protein [Chitinophaga sp. GbtcB8]|uniref:lysine N(6)-hydroxylase/L-ornithine N(5)-oxygenase family protein n=1 Tax=Chitinophaga sp. GbtcB8 TaxID=2824753 RepID=UPI001C2F9A9A|nr:SidA/IucD/PvdA family monooxygenase [Chitinophaga sp. GbtcB8]
MLTTNESSVYDLLGVGIGPSNLSTAALIAPYNQQVNSIFFDDKSEFNWYPGMLFPDATIQVSILKDLVTMVDPTSQFTFLNFLKETGRLYMFASKGQFDGLKRREFVQYFKWAVARMQNLHFMSTVQRIEYKDDCFEVTVNDVSYKAKNLAMGAGLSANVPGFCRKHIGSGMVHSSQFLTSNVDFSGKRIMVVGGGQSGAEVILFLLKEEERLPLSVQWISSNYNFLPLENTPFSNELYTPKYSDYFYNLHKEDKEKLLERQKFTSDGVSEKTLSDIYETIYNYKFLRDIDILDFYPGTYFTNAERTENCFCAEVTLKEKSSAVQYMDVDIIVLATGFNYQQHKCLEPLDGYISTTDGKYDVAEDFSIVTTKDMKGKIYIHNGARHVRGVADPNLSLLAWRSAKIINALMEQKVYNTEIDKSLLSWDKLTIMKNGFRARAI